MTLNFKRKIEDFICENCGAKVTGNGYTNHCPSCLFSKHVDMTPGDRASDCGGLMEPVSVTSKGGEVVEIVHKCLNCEHEKANKISPEDDQNALINII